MRGVWPDPPRRSDQVPGMRDADPGKPRSLAHQCTAHRRPDQVGVPDDRRLDLLGLAGRRHMGRQWVGISTPAARVGLVSRARRPRRSCRGSRASAPIAANPTRPIAAPGWLALGAAGRVTRSHRPRPMRRPPRSTHQMGPQRRLRPHPGACSDRPRLAMTGFHHHGKERPCARQPNNQTPATPLS